MAFKGDTTPIKLQLLLTNYAEGLEVNPRYHVRQISFMITTLEDGCGTNDVLELDYAHFLSAEDQEVLNWQAGTKNLQNDVEIRSTLTALSGRLCPYKNISFSFFDKVTDCDAHQRRADPCPFSAYRHSTFRSVMLTQHSAADGQVQLLFSCDGLPVDRSCLRWRSHDYIKLEFPNARTSSYRVFWLVQWDVVDMTDFINEGHVASTGPGTGLGNNDRGLSSGLAASQSQGGDSQKFIGTRHRPKRQSPWIVEIKPKGCKKKFHIGSFKTQEAAARAADSGHYHYKRGRLNFPDSQKHLEEIPSDVNDEEKQKRVKDQAHKLAKLAEKPPSAGMVKFWLDNTKSEGFTSQNSGINSGSDNTWLATNASFESLPRPDSVAISSMEAYLDDVRPSASFGTDVWRETVGNSLEQEILSTSNDWFKKNSEVSSGGLCPEVFQEFIREPTLSPVFKVFSYPDQNSVPDISNDMAEYSPTDIACAGILDSDNSILHHEIERQMASTGYNSSLLVAEPEQSELNGDWASYLYLVDWILNE